MYCSLTDLKEYLGITSTKQDTLLTRCIETAQREIETYTLKVFENSDTASTKTFDANNEYISKDGYSFTIPYDLRSLSEITIDSNDVSSYIISYLSFDGIIYELGIMGTSPYTFKDYSTSFYNTISITGTWGYSTTPPADIENACITLAQYIYQRKDTTITGDRALLPNNSNSVALTYSMPIDVKTTLDRYRRVVLYEYS